MTSQKVQNSQLIQAFDSTVNSNMKLATKEIWIISSDDVPSQPKISCIVRNIRVGSELQSQDQWKKEADLTLKFAKRDFRTIYIGHKALMLKELFTTFALSIIRFR